MRRPKLAEINLNHRPARGKIRPMTDYESVHRDLGHDDGDELAAAVEAYEALEYADAVAADIAETKGQPGE